MQIMQSIIYGDVKLFCSVTRSPTDSTPEYTVTVFKDNRVWISNLIHKNGFDWPNTVQWQAPEVSNNEINLVAHGHRNL